MSKIMQVCAFMEEWLRIAMREDRVCRTLCTPNTGIANRTDMPASKCIPTALELNVIEILTIL